MKGITISRSILKLFSLIILFLTFLFITPLTPNAYALTVSCGTGGCSMDSPEPLINSTNIYPTWTEQKTLTVTNNYNESRVFAIEVQDTHFWDDLFYPVEKAIRISIKEEGASTFLYGPKTLSDFKKDGYILLSAISAGASKNYVVTFTMDDVGNEYQNKTLRFNLAVGFETVTDTSNNGNNGNNSSGNGGSNNGNSRGGTSSPSGADEVVGQVAGAAVATSVFGQIQQIQGDSTLEILGEADEFDSFAPLNADDGDVAGESICRDRIWWVWILLLQFILHVLVRVFTKHKIPQILLTAIFVCVFWMFFCPRYDFVVSAIIGALLTFLTVRRR